MNFTAGLQRIGHPGNVPPFHSEFSFYPAMNIGIFSSTNQMPVNPTIYHPQLHRAILDILRGENPSEIKCKSKLSNGGQIDRKFQRKEVKTVALPEEELEKFLGVYGNGLEGKTLPQ